MALSGSVTTGAYKNHSVTLNWAATQNVATNTSTISWSLVGSGTTSGYVVVAELRVKFNGVEVYYRSPDNRTNCYYGTVLATGTHNIAHNADGSQSLGVTVEAGIYYHSINQSGSANFTLDSIARASSITSANNTTLGKACRISWTPASTNFYYKIRFTLGGWSYTTGAIHPNVTSSYTYTGYVIPIASVAPRLPNSTTGTMTAYLYTYSNSACTAQIGSTSSRNFSVTVPGSVVPSITSVSASIVNDNETVNGWGVAIVGYTKVKIVASAKGSYGSSINSYILSGGYSTTINSSSLAYTGGIITSSGNKVFTVAAKDTRGRLSSSVSTVSIPYYAYSTPSITSFTAVRSQNNVSSVTVKANWSFSSIDNKNSVSAILQYKKSNESGWTTYGEIARDTDTVLDVEFEEASSYNFRLTVKDMLDNIAQNEVSVSTIKVLLDFKAGGKGLGIGKIAETDALEIALDVKFLGNMYVRDGADDIPLETYFMKKTYEPGDLKLTMNNINPGTYITGTTWILIAQGKTIFGVDPNDPNFNEANKTGGSKEHSHNLSSNGYAKANIGGSTPFELDFVRVQDISYQSGLRVTGGSDSFQQGYERTSNRGIALGGKTDSASWTPPFVTCYIWMRTA